MRRVGFAAVLAIVPVVAPAQESRLVVELNKLEPAEGTCQAFFLFRNGTGRTLEAFELSLAVLDSEGIIDRLLSIDAAPVPLNRTTLRLFEIPGMACTDVSEIILHEVPSCAAQDGEPLDCFSVIELVSRADARLVK